MAIFRQQSESIGVALWAERRLNQTIESGAEKEATMNRFTLLLYLVLSVSADAQNQKNTSPSSSSQKQGIGQSFDMERTNLPPHFLGNNADAIYDAAKLNLPRSTKSEFESMEQYQARMVGQSNRPFLGGLKASDHFAFVLGQAWSGAAPVSGSGESRGRLYGYIETNYDAESRTLAIKLPLESLSDAEGNAYRWASLWHRVRTHLGSYVGQNAFGAKRIVSRLGVTDTDLIIEDAGWLDFDCDHELFSQSCSFAIDPPQAKVLSRNVRVIVVGSLVPPFVSSESDVSQATIDAPAEIHHSRRLLHMRLEQLLIADTLTGEIVKKYSRTKHSEEYPVNVEFRLAKDLSFSDARCTQDAYLFPSLIIAVNYSIDGGEERQKYLDKPLLISARQFVDVEITYCNIPRVEVLLNGKHYTLECERQEWSIFNLSKCSGIQLAP